MVIKDWPPTMLSPVYSARRKWEKRERAERTRPTRATHLSFDLKTIFPIQRKAEIKGETPPKGRKTRKRKQKRLVTVSSYTAIFLLQLAFGWKKGVKKTKSPVT